MLLACLLVLRRGLDLVRFVYFVWVVLSVAFLARVCALVGLAEQSLSLVPVWAIEWFFG